MHNNCDLILASSSKIRANLLEASGLRLQVESPRVDEETVKQALLADNCSPRDVADALAELKAIKVSSKSQGKMVVGCDQTLDLGGALFDKPTSVEEVIDHLRTLSGRPHKLHSAAVICEDGKPVWRHVGTVTLTMRKLSEEFIVSYANRNWPSLSQSLGGYKLEEEGVRLFMSIRGEYHDVLGLPLLPLLNWLTIRGILQS